MFKNGWFHTGDLAVIHKDGYVELKDRKKDIIISGGENISSIEIENCLSSHPAISICAVVAMKDEKWGEVPCAFIETLNGITIEDRVIIKFAKKTWQTTKYLRSLYSKRFLKLLQARFKRLN